MTEPPRPPEGNDPYNDPYAQTPPPGYQPPPPPGYGPPQGYPPPQGYGYGGYQQPPGAGEDRTWIVLTHFISALVAFLSSGTLGWVMPLITLLSQGARSPQVRAEAVQALNFQILWSVLTIVGYILICVFIGWLVVLATWLIAWIVPLIAGIKATNGQPFRYPLNVSIIK
ncbi:DUF4870 domain-containing protein [Actinoplanes sp. CA-015351]|uniref:DUF4870 domain-containing protein n=1 Tax=Actinoplanes sp. CA-015351 TaxID=3239897 RepID=UPI003D98B95D